MPEKPQNLTQYLHSLGGLIPCSELKAIEAPLVILNRNGLPLDYAARLASVDGFAIGEDLDALIDCIGDEMFGERHYAANDAGTALDSDAWQDWHENSINVIPF